MKIFACLMMVLVLCLSGCAHKKLQEEKSATELVEEGQKKFEARDYKSAITAFERVKDWYPFSDQVPTAQMKIAEAHYKLREYDQAAAAYEEFANLHPKNPLTPYAMYQVGRCFYDQMHTIDRDQENTKKALAAFKRLLNRWPDSEYTGPTRAHITECQRRLASHELLVAKYYFRRKNYQAALARFQNVINDYSDTGVQYIALQYLAKCEAHIKNEASKTAVPAAPEAAVADTPAP